MVIEGCTHPTNFDGAKIERSKINEQQKKDNKNNHRSRTILLYTIFQVEYEKITNKDSAKFIFDSLRMTHEVNTQVKEAKALALIQKYGFQNGRGQDY